MAKYSDEVKALCMAALLAGESQAAVAKRYKVHHNTVQRLAAALRKSGAAKLDRGHTEKIKQLLLEYLQESLVTLAAQAIHFRSKVYLTKGSAQELGIGHGVLFDKVVRVLEAAEASAEPAEPADDEGSVVPFSRSANGSS